MLFHFDIECFDTDSAYRVQTRKAFLRWLLNRKAEGREARLRRFWAFYARHTSAERESAAYWFSRCLFYYGTLYAVDIDVNAWNVYLPTYRRYIEARTAYRALRKESR